MGLKKKHIKNKATQPEYWTFWQQPDADNPRWQAEAKDLVIRLSTLIPDLKDRHILDYGCGLGLVAINLALRVQAIDLWDSSESARRHAYEISKAFSNVKVLSQIQENSAYDLILVSSVTQYMTEDQLQRSMMSWKRMLKSDGVVLITDIIPPRRRMVSEIFDLLRFAARYRLILRMFWDGVCDLPNYWKNLHQRPLTHFALGTMTSLAVAANFKLEEVENPNMFHSRYAVFLKPNMLDNRTN